MRVLDLFCKAGGAAMGLHRAWPDAEIIGVDIEPQPNYPFKFVQADAMVLPFLVCKFIGGSIDGHPEWCDRCGFDFDVHAGFDFVWASPPCQAYTMMRHMGKNAGVGAPKLIEPIRRLLRKSGLPYVIENVPGAPLEQPIQPCGSSFGLGVQRHRLFEASFFVLSPPCRHGDWPIPVWGDGRPSRKEARAIAVYGDHPQQPGDKTYRCNRARTLAMGRHAMGIDWMDWKELTQAIPPAYSEYIAKNWRPI